MKNFYGYLSESINTYKYRIRTLKELTDIDIEYLGRIFDQYDIVELSDVIRTPMQDSPMDFPNYSMVNVYILDVELKVPVSTYILQNRVRAALNIPNSSIVVRMENDPVELETLRLNNFGNWDEREPLLSTEPAYHEYNYEADKVVPYGDEFNQKFLKFLASVKKRREEIVPESPEPENTKRSDYSILKELDSDALLYNKDMDGVKPVYQSEVTNDEPEPIETAVHGNFDSISRLASKIVIKGK